MTARSSVPLGTGPLTAAPPPSAALAAAGPVAEEREVLVDQPAKKFDGVGDVPVRYRQRRRVRRQLVGDRQRLGAHPGPVLDRLAHIREYPLHVPAQLVAVGLAVHPVDGQPHPALHQVTGDRVVRLHVGAHLDQPAQRLTAHHDQRVYQQVHGQPPGHQRGGDGVDEERHVVGDDLDHGQVAVRAVLDAQLQLARYPLLREVPVRPRVGEHARRRQSDQVLVRGEPPVPADQPRAVEIIAGQRHRLCDEALGVRQRLVQLGVLRLFGLGVLDTVEVVIEVVGRVAANRPRRQGPPRVRTNAGDRTLHRCHSPRPPTTLWDASHCHPMTSWRRAPSGRVPLAASPTECELSDSSRRHRGRGGLRRLRIVGHNRCRRCSTWAKPLDWYPHWQQSP
jgi:hypothetical protein